ncbi:MAG TPA: S41 family peptidase [Solirubrobacteraceae bacterium]|jgi:carboxyl-terminal processing protease|nr:S41 family peptidase [Solirubrobacteraceae bacterium]
MYARRRQRSPWLPRILVGLVVLLVGLWFGGHPSWLPGPVRNTFVAQSNNDKLINQVLGLIQNDYYRKVPRSQLVNKGLAAAVASLDDPYSNYYDPSEYSTFQNQDNPHLSGIGIDIKLEPQGLLVQDVFDGSPAAKAGLVSGDMIVAVGSTPLAGRPVGFSAGLIKGRAGTKVTLTVQRGRHRHVVVVQRANLVVPVAASRILTYHGVKLGYVELTSFTAGSGEEVRQQVQQVLHEGARGLILDLRENGGGLLEEAVNIASIFISNGTIVSTDGRAQPRQVYMAKGDAIAASQPMVVLVDSGTASSAEIVTAALQQRGRAKVVGTHTYGKGVFQEIDPLPNGGALDFTVGEFFTPDGENLGGGGVKRGPGIKPDVYAYTKPTAKTDTALTVAERTVAAELQ